MSLDSISLAPSDFFDLSKTAFADFFTGCAYPWEVLKHLEACISRIPLGHVAGKIMSGAWVDENVSIGEGTVVEHNAVIRGPAYIGKNCQIRASAYVRGNAVIEDGAIVGNACEIKHAWLFPQANVPHFAYVGDSVLGFKAHLGAGVKISNVKLDSSNVDLVIQGHKFKTGLWKFGAIVGDEVDIGCNAVLNPGTLIGPRSQVYSGVNWRGYCPNNSIVKLKQSVQIVEKQAK